MKTVLAVAAAAGASQAMTLDANVQLFNEWKVEHGKTYKNDAEELQRFLTFKTNAAYINSHNMNANKTYTMGLNRFADMNNEEYKDAMLGAGYKPQRNGSVYLEPKGVSLPKSMDWRTEGYVTPVKDQGQCGSCWAFSAVASLEGQYFKKNGKLASFSEQQLVDCSGDFGNSGCNGGLMNQGFDYMKALGNHGIDVEASYPYTGRDGSCKALSGTFADPPATVTGFSDIRSGSEWHLHIASATVGPISVAIDASQMSFQFYSSGVYDEPMCSSTYLDHGVAVVGYGKESDSDYWIVKNSWGPDWGEDGYIRMSRNKKNQCGIASTASFPRV